MKKKLGYLFTNLMALYFLVSGLSILFDVPAKLKRIDLNAINSDGEIAFILIYTGLMTGIGVAILLLQYLSGTWIYSALLATIIIGSFIVFRIVGSIMVGFLSPTQINFLVFESIEVTVGVLLLVKEKFKIPLSTSP
ncbi:hypothetical protein JQC67_12435 [Aurantibacter crassamenti]|uniref:hypothetical protein n=1 Tax=Aurantibacter crassamenti TaxID=1837375 RepID=UPI00193A7464|nr:hypothetical protein [Aurantibacter crassamenti]MBM1106950.1 hypothetical protein [Aurantibacter crassamenti]